MIIAVQKIGDFYEAFDGDARLLSDHTDITLTKVNERLIAGFPTWSLEKIRDKLNAKNIKLLTPTIGKDE